MGWTDPFKLVLKSGIAWSQGRHHDDTIKSSRFSMKVDGPFDFTSESRLIERGQGMDNKIRLGTKSEYTQVLLAYLLYIYAVKSFWPPRFDDQDRPFLFPALLFLTRDRQLDQMLRNELGLDRLWIWSSKNPGLKIRLSGLSWILLLSPDSGLNSRSSWHAAVMQFHFDGE